MTAGTLVDSSRSTSRESQTGVSELPPAVGGWSLTPVPAGWWLSDAGRGAPASVRDLLAEPGRAALVIDADGPDERTDRLLRELSATLPSAGITAVRLVLSSAGRYAVASSWLTDIDLIAADGPVVITPHGYALVRPTEPVNDGEPPQWRRRLPGGGCEAAGTLAPSPGWERGLADVLAAERTHDLLVRRVPAGLALAWPGRAAWLASAAQQLWPDPERPIIVVDSTVSHQAIRADLAGLLAPLAHHAAAGIRLHWPRAGVAGSAPMLGELAGELGIDLIVPAADVSACGFGGMCHGPSGAAPWLVFGSDGNVSTLGSLYPEPAWERALAEDALVGLPADLVVEDVAAGLCVYRQGASHRGLSATARSILPDPARITIIVGGDADDAVVQQHVAAVLGRLPANAAGSVRLLLAGAASGGHDSYAQSLADGFDCEIVAPAGRWTATPDGHPRALVAPSSMTRPEAGGWDTFLPRRAVPAEVAPAEVAPAEVAPVETVPEAAAEPAQAYAEPSPPEVHVPAIPSAVAMLPRDHRSTAAERMAYRESAPDFQGHSVSVRRMMTQRPGLRSAAAGEAMDVVAADFTAVLDFLSGDRQAAAAEFRSRGTAGNARVACVLSGLRRLPSFTGAVFSSASLPRETADCYPVGVVLIEPAFVEASSSHLVAMPGGVEYVIWSQTGKRIAAVADWADRDEVMFAAATCYRVLRVDPATSGAGRPRVFLRELPISTPPTADGSLDETDRRVLERLLAAAALRDGAVAGDQLLAWRPGAVAPIGLNDLGERYARDEPTSAADSKKR